MDNISALHEAAAHCLRAAESCVYHAAVCFCILVVALMGALLVGMLRSISWNEVHLVPSLPAGGKLFGLDKVTKFLSLPLPLVFNDGISMLLPAAALLLASSWRQRMLDLVELGAYGAVAAAGVHAWERNVNQAEPQWVPVVLVSVVAAHVVKCIQLAAFDQQLRGRASSAWALASWTLVSLVATVACICALQAVGLLATMGVCSLWRLTLDFQSGQMREAAFGWPSVSWQASKVCMHSANGYAQPPSQVLMLNALVACIALALLICRGFLCGVSSTFPSRALGGQQGRSVVAAIVTCGLTTGCSRCIRLHEVALTSRPARFVTRWVLATAATSAAICATITSSSLHQPMQNIPLWLDLLQCPQVWSMGILLAAIVRLDCV